MGIAGAVAGATALTGIAGAAMSSSAAGHAADVQAAANQQAIAEQQRQFDTTQHNIAPWLQAGQAALGGQLNLLGLGGSAGTAGTPDYNGYLTANPDVMQGWQNLSPQDKAQFPTPQSYAQYHYQTYGQNEGRALPTTGGTAAATGGQAQQSAIDQLQQSPLYQSLFRNGQDTLLNNAAATGGLRGGNTAHSLANFGADTLSQVIQQQLANLGGISNTGNTSATNLGQLGQNNANNQSALLSQNGQSQAGGILGSAGIWNNAFNGLGKSLGGIIQGAPTGAFGLTPNAGLYADAGNTIAANPGIF